MPKRTRRPGEIPDTGLPKNAPPPHPGEMLLEEFLKPSDMSQAEAARRMDLPVNRVNELVKGKRGITARTALRLGTLFGTTAEFWMGLQADWELWHAQRDEKKLGRAS